MKILVTGGAGFIGSNLADVLIKKNHEVAIIDDLSNGYKENVSPKAKFFKIDISNAEALRSAFDEFAPEVIFHLAAQANVRVSISDPTRDHEVNVIGTLNLLENAVRSHVKHIIFSSTGGAIYGDDAERPTPETAKAEPVSPYGQHKLQSEKNILRFACENGFKATILRYANVYGPRQNPKGGAGVIAIFADKMLTKKPLTVNGDGEQTRDYVFVKDVVNANVKAFENEIEGTFNIGTGRETSLNEIIASLQKICAVNTPAQYLPANSGELLASCLDVTKAKNELGWQVEVTLDEGLKQTVDYLKEKL